MPESTSTDLMMLDGLPNILAFVNHAPDIERRDLHATVAGLPVGDGKRIFMLCHKLQEQVLDGARKIDLFLWIDAQKRALQYVSMNEAPHQKAALDLLGLLNQDTLKLLIVSAIGGDASLF